MKRRKRAITSPQRRPTYIFIPPQIMILLHFLLKTDCYAFSDDDISPYNWIIYYEYFLPSYVLGAVVKGA